MIRTVAQAQLEEMQEARKKKRDSSKSGVDKQDSNAGKYYKDLD